MEAGARAQNRWMPSALEFQVTFEDSRVQVSAVPLVLAMVGLETLPRRKTMMTMRELAAGVKADNA